jgi:chemotaxis response regulator CheB
VIPIRTAVVTMSPMLRDIVKELPTRGVRLKIVAEFGTRDLLLEQLKTIRPDMVLIGLARAETDQIGRTILLALPWSRVIVFSSGARHLYIHEMRPHRRVLSDVSAQAVIRALRASNRILIPSQEV